MYNSFARGYDLLTDNIAYKQFADYYEEIFARQGIKPELVLDLGCGTGTVTAMMANRGYDMIGVDISGEMLNIARTKTDKVLFLQQDMTDFELYGTVDVIYSALDAVNYVLSKKDLKRMFRLVKNYLNFGGIFIFDINTPHKFQNVLDGNTFVYDKESVYCVWQNELDKRSGICTFFIDLFYREKGTLFERFYEEHYERAYEPGELGTMLKEAGLKLLGTYDAFSFRRPKPASERIFMVAQKIGESR